MTEQEFKNSPVKWTKKRLKLIAKNKSYSLMNNNEYEWITALAKFLCDYTKPSSVLEIGYGLGYTAECFSKVSKHIIIEPHPQIFEKAKEWAKNKSNVILINDFVQNVKNIEVDFIYDDRYDIVYGQELDLQNFKYKYYVLHVMEHTAKILTKGIDFIYKNQLYKIPIRWHN